MRPPSITHLTATAITALALAVPGVADAAVFAPPPGVTSATAPTTTPAPGASPTSTAPGASSTPATSTPAPSATPKVSTGQAKGAAPGAAKPTTSVPVRTVTSPATSSTSSESSSNSDTLLILTLAAAVALLVGIAFMILRDAHSVAPVTDGPEGGAATRNPAGKLRKRRAKAKAARRQRRRNR